MFVWISNSSVHICCIFNKLFYMLKLCSTSCEYNSCYEFLFLLFMAIVFYFHVSLLYYFNYSSVNYLREIFQTYFLGLSTSKSGNRNYFVILVFTWPSRSKFNFEELCLFFDNRATFFNVFGNHI